MILKTPHYYKNFTCIADKCIDNCCFGGWQIDIDDETFDYYMNVPGEFGDRLREAVDTESCCFKLVNGQCPFLQENNLCEIYGKLGPDKMGVVCTQFPRFSEYYGNVKETGIGLACEEAARIILNDEADFNLDESALDENEIEGEYDSELGSALFTLRDKLMKLLDSHADKPSIRIKLQVILDAFAKLQPMINDNDYEAVREFCEEFDYRREYDNISFNYIDSDNTNYDNIDSHNIESNNKITYGVEENNINNTNNNPTSIIYSDKASDKNSNTAGNNDNDKDIHSNDGILDEKEYHTLCEKIWWNYLDLEPINGYWEDFSDKAYGYIYGDIVHGSLESSLHAYYPKLVKYYLFRYMLKASFDHDILNKAQLIIANLVIIRDMTIYACQSIDRADILKILHESIQSHTNVNKAICPDESTDTFTSAFMHVIHIFSRQIEYSEDNILELYDAFLFDDVFSHENLTKILRGI